MVEKLTKLYNTMLCIETKGANTKTMANCLTYLEMLIQEANHPVTAAEKDE